VCRKVRCSLRWNLRFAAKQDITFRKAVYVSLGHFRGSARPERCPLDEQTSGPFGARRGREADAIDLGGINLGELDSSTTVQRRSWSGGRSEPDLSAAWLARGSFEAGYRKLREHDATKPSRSSAGKSVVRFGPRFLQPVNGAEKP
jgi:hypothetical protein